MASQGPKGGSTFADDSSIGTVAWTSPSNAQTEDGTNATASLTTSNKTSHYLKATNFGFSIPSGATINGIIVEVKAAYSVNQVFINNVKLVKAGTFTGTANTTLTGLTTTLTFYTFGTSSDLWGTTWTDTDINNSGFGVGVSVNNPISTRTGLIDYIKITVYYTGGSSVVTSNFFEFF